MSLYTHSKRKALSVSLANQIKSSSMSKLGFFSNAAFLYIVVQFPRRIKDYVEPGCVLHTLRHSTVHRAHAH